MTVLILLADGFEDLQFFCPLNRLKEEGINVRIATPGGQRVTGQHGYRVEADTPIREVNPAEYDLLLIPGGQSPERLRLREEAVDIARTFMDEDRPVAVIGHGPQRLISAGSLQGKQATSTAGIRDDLRAADASYRDEAVVQDGNLLTCRSNDDLADFCRQMMSFLHTRA